MSGEGIKTACVVSKECKHVYFFDIPLRVFEKISWNLRFPRYRKVKVEKEEGKFSAARNRKFLIFSVQGINLYRE